MPAWQALRDDDDDDAQVFKKASQQIAILSRLKNSVPVPAKLTLFKSAILPHLTYFQKVWHFARASDNRKLERSTGKGFTRNLSG